MQIQARLLAVSLALGLASPLLAQTPGGHSGSHAGKPGGHYGGPGDTVPTKPGGSPNAPPSAGGPGEAGPGQPSGPPMVAPSGPAPGSLPGESWPSLPPDEPATPDSVPPVSDGASWQLWWHYNRWDYLPVGRAAELLARTGTEHFFLGRGVAPEMGTALRASDEEIGGLVQPALLEALSEGGQAELVVYALQALAKVRAGDAEAGLTFDAVARHYLQDKNQEIAEGALIALGVRGDAAWTAPLVGVLHDTEEGQKLVARSRVGSRQRAFAAYALALLAERNPDGAYRRELYPKLVSALADERPEVQAAVLAAIGHCALPPAPAGAEAGAPLGLAEQIQAVAAFLADDKQAAVARGQAPYALGFLGRNAPEPLRVAAISALCAQLGPHSKAPTEVQNGAVIALGDLGCAQASAADLALRELLQRTVVGSGADRLTRYLALISLGRTGSRSGNGEDPFAGLDPTRNFLQGQVERSRGLELAWASLALGVLERGAQERGGLPAAASAQALRSALVSSRNADVAGGVALALGMLQDVEAVPTLLLLLTESGSPVVRGYSGLALGMIGAPQALKPLREALPGTATFPGSLQRVAMGLSLLGDAQAGAVLAAMLIKSASPEVDAAVAAALGWVKDPRPLPALVEHLREEESDLARAWVSVALGRIVDTAPRPWNAELMISANYDQSPDTLRDPQNGQGVLDYP